MSDVEIRPAQVVDAPDIVRLNVMSSSGVIEYMWSKLAKSGQDLHQIGVEQFSDQARLATCTMAGPIGGVRGFLKAYPIDGDTTHIQNDEADPILEPFALLQEPASFYIASVALYPRFRGEGIGTRLLAAGERQAAAAGLRKTSLIVFEENRGAARLYAKLGYFEVNRTPVIPHPLIQTEGDAILLVKQLH